MDFIAAIGGTAWTVFFFIVALSIIVFVHEYGHYIVGRWSGIHSEVFSVGFGPVLWSRLDKRGTRWQVAAVPFGGYVRFMGDADATSVRHADVSGLSARERRHTMAGAPLWARSATVVAGPVANFILTFLLLMGIILALGIPRDEVTVGKALALPGVETSLVAGDVVLALNGSATPDRETFATVARDLPVDEPVVWTLRRGDTTVDVAGPHPLPALVAGVSIRSAAMDAGLKGGDVIIRAGGQDVSAFAQLPDIVKATEGAPIDLTVWRDGATFDVTLTPRVRALPKEDGTFEERYLIGLESGAAFEPATRQPGLLEAVQLSGAQMWTITTTTFRSLGKMIVGQLSTCNLSGAIGMAETMGDAARKGAIDFISMMAILSLGVGILNLFPIPVLDGGHLVFHAYEAVMRRPPSDRALRVLMSIGLTLVLGLMAFALSRDLICV
ncbi:RIP metalloprotease RseP [Tabrizicola sp.]|uniref:RIP metalloprotease RseP n=1 Tax=Tabrizicola sp. TaxID=2005166 RepID=UPI0026039B03|nr:RIP metalloprotease RseP [Tabrizicola sp.]MDM7930798.1 RIP metalloprotease RseP [Tabrizicola sp.]